MRRPLASLVCLLLLSLPSAALAQTLTKDTVWSGVVRVEEDLLVPRGVTLTIEPGTRVLFAEAVSTKTDPQFWSPDTEIAVEGRLTALGTPEAPISFAPEGALWGGLVAAPGGVVHLERATLKKASEALLAQGAELSAKDTTVEDAEYGLVLGRDAKLQAQGLALNRCRKGVMDLRGPKAAPLDGVVALASQDAPLLRWDPGPPPASPPLSAPPAGGRELLGEYTVYGEETWQGTVVISGRVTVPPESRLTLAPGTRVAFRRVDTNGDGLGEGELLILGSIRSLGTAANPIVFDSAESSPAPGDWDKVSLISSEDPQNRFEHTVFRYGAQALHSHFSRLSARDCLFEGNLRAVQFQESEGVVLEACRFLGNKQALRFRDSNVRVEDCLFSGNLYTLHAFRAELAFRNNVVEGTLLGGLLAKESRLILKGNRLAGNRSALRVRGEGSAANLAGNVLMGSAESLLTMSDTAADFSDNRFSGAGLDLVGIEGGKAKLRDNRFGTAGRDAIHINGLAEVDARENFWQGDPSARIFDGKDLQGLGIVLWSPVKIENTPLSDSQP